MVSTHACHEAHTGAGPGPIGDALRPDSQETDVLTLLAGEILEQGPFLAGCLHSSAHKQECQEGIEPLPAALPLSRPERSPLAHPPVVSPWPAPRG